MPLFRPNIAPGGRLIRGLTGLLLAGAALACVQTPWLAIVLALGSGFVLFEAVRGWCVLRACGIKTRW